MPGRFLKLQLLPKENHRFRFWILSHCHSFRWISTRMNLTRETSPRHCFQCQSLRRKNRSGKPLNFKDSQCFWLQVIQVIQVIQDIQPPFKPELFLCLFTRRLLKKWDDFWFFLKHIPNPQPRSIGGSGSSWLLSSLTGGVREAWLGMYIDVLYVGVSKNSGFSPNMDGENNGKPYFLMDGL